MADKNAIAKKLRLIVNNGRETEENIIMCTVVSVSGIYCVCQPLDEEQAEIVDVRLVSEESDTNFIITPSVGSVVGVLAFSDVEVSEFMVVLFSEIDTINIRGDQYGGLVKIEDLVTKLNNLENKVNTIITWGATVSPPLATAPLIATVRANIENENVTHG